MRECEPCENGDHQGCLAKDWTFLTEYSDGVKPRDGTECGCRCTWNDRTEVFAEMRIMVAPGTEEN